MKRGRLEWGRLRSTGRAVRAFYRQPIAVVALVVSSALLTYGGGAVMFWFHAIFRGEQGPAIGDLYHWLLDSSLGFVALTPILAVILPFGVWAASRTTDAAAGSRAAYVTAVAALFTLTTGPGPFLHNLVAGSGTPLAEVATDVFGHDRTVAARTMHVHDRSALAEGALQLVVGLPVYLGATWLSVVLVRWAVGRGRRGRRGRRLHQRRRRQGDRQIVATGLPGRPVTTPDPTGVRSAASSAWTRRKDT